MYFLLSHNWVCPQQNNYIYNIIPWIHFRKYFKMCFCLGPPTQNNEEISLVRNSLRKINLKTAQYAEWVTRISAELPFFIYCASENCKSHMGTHKRQTAAVDKMVPFNTKIWFMHSLAVVHAGPKQSGMQPVISNSCALSNKWCIHKTGKASV